MRTRIVSVDMLFTLLVVYASVSVAYRAKTTHATLREGDNPFADPCSAERFEHDIALDEETKKLLGRGSHDSHTRSRRAATADSRNLWPRGVVPYAFDSRSAYTLAQQAIILQSIRHWEKHTCLTFLPKKDGDRNYVVFYKGSCGCCSYVGVAGGKQGISIGSNCYTVGIVVHEIGHAIGYWHEHTRPDRDRHVEVLWDNIKTEDKHNFAKQLSYKVDSIGEPYDYDSIMHYSRNTFSKSSRLNTLRPRKQGVTIGQRSRLSVGDIRQTNKLYQCPVCGGVLATTSGAFSSLRNGSTSTCVWRIRVEKGYYIKLRLATDREGEAVAGRCQGPYIEIKETIVSQRLSQYCIDGETYTTESPGSQLYVSFTRDLRHPSRGFSASYTTTCYKHFTTAFGVLESPGFPSNYPSSAECQWVITGQGKINISFNVFDMERHSRCSYDYIELRDGPTIDSRLIKRLCGGSLPNKMSTTGNVLFVRFKSDRSLEKMGFSMTWQSDTDECATVDKGSCMHDCFNFIGGYRCGCKIGYILAPDKRNCQLDCGGMLTSTSGVIFSPNYPRHYPDNKECEWHIDLPPGAKTILYFTELDVESGGSSCIYDRVAIYDSASPTPKLFGPYCNGNRPGILNLNNEVRIVFQTDRSTVRRGFRLTYRSTGVDECKSSNGGCQMICVDKEEGHECRCPSGYRLNTDGQTCAVVNKCLINNGGCQMICIKQQQASHRCGCSYGYRLNPDGRTCKDIDECAEVRDSCHHSCVNTKGSYYCSCPAGYQITDDGIACIDTDECALPEHGNCSQICKNTRGSFYCMCLPGYQMNKKGICKRIKYCRPKYCAHKCQNLATSYRCECNDGYKLMPDKKHCEDIDECAVRNGNCSHVCINFEGGYNCSCPSSDYVLRSDRRSCYRCRGQMGSTAQHLGLPAQAVVTDKGAKCLWSVKVDPGQRIKLTVVKLPTDNCSATQIKVVELNRQLCHSEGSRGSEVMSSANVIRVSLRSEQVGHQLNGFLMARYSSVCGGTLRATLLNQTIYSHHGYGTKSYPASTTCMWTLSAKNKNYQIHVESDQFALEQSDSCRKDYVQVNENRYCGHSVALSYTSTSPVQITFHSDQDVQDSGFSIKYYATERSRTSSRLETEQSRV